MTFLPSYYLIEDHRTSSHNFSPANWRSSDRTKAELRPQSKRLLHCYRSWRCVLSKSRKDEESRSVNGDTRIVRRGSEIGKESSRRPERDSMRYKAVLERVCATMRVSA